MKESSYTEIHYKMDESSPFINFDRDKSPEEVKMKGGKVFVV